jgi:hypothetical protein
VVYDACVGGVGDHVGIVANLGAADPAVNRRRL